ncbi:hypothetical protein CTI12_AA588700 [Artemisia annua]|uniref:Helitron helicase-like domain-containing protein n=1 Tax=Artemisia annua TaxID=35608 RepID=A0A2U1KLG7_ARTAN|nr:hypothetical protein CTI12_AA588700 [Artemisia annua]
MRTKTKALRRAEPLSSRKDESTCNFDKEQGFYSVDVESSRILSNVDDVALRLNCASAEPSGIHATTLHKCIECNILGVNHQCNHKSAMLPPFPSETIPPVTNTEESATKVQMAGAENLSMIDDNWQPIIPQHLKANDQRLTLPLANESIHLYSSGSEGQSTAYEMRPHTTSHTCYTRSMDKGKSRMSEVSNKDQTFQQPCAFTSFPESHSGVQLLCTENFSSVASSQHQITPGHLTYNSQHLPLPSHSHIATRSSNESKHSYYYKVHPVSTRNRGRGRPRKRPITSIQEPGNATNVTHSDQHLSQPGSSSNVSAQSQFMPANASNLNPSTGGLRRHRRGAANSSSARNQRREHPRDRNRSPRQDIVANLIEVLDEHNELVQLFRTARNKMQDADIPQFKVRLYGVIGSRQHELPTGDSIGAIVFEGGADVETDFDVVIERHDRRLQRVNKLNASYMSLQFPLIFLYGEDGYHLGRVLLNTGASDDAPKKMTMLNVQLANY